MNQHKENQKKSSLSKNLENKFTPIKKIKSNFNERDGTKLVRSWPEVGPKLVRSWPEVGPKLARNWSAVSPKNHPTNQSTNQLRISKPKILKDNNNNIVVGLKDQQELLISDTDRDLKTLPNWHERIFKQKIEDPLYRGSSIPRSSIPRSSIPRSSIPRSSIPRSSIPRSSIPRSSIPRSSIPRSSIPRSSIPKQIKKDDEPTEIPYFNQCFDKSRVKSLVTWYVKVFGENIAVELVEKLKELGFYYATHAGISIGIDDLKIPANKFSLVAQAETSLYSLKVEFSKGNLTSIERFQKLIETWHRTSESIKQNVINYFRSTNVLNPIYMMAFSGARGNISQVRQLVGMRGLMADPQGRILDFPIQSNFREGLTLTEYIISCYGARKGVVDTALRTAKSGYLTRRLVDVAQHIVVSKLDCGTELGLLVKDLKSRNKVLLNLERRLVGRVLAETIYLSPDNKKTDVINIQNENGLLSPNIQKDQPVNPYAESGENINKISKTDNKQIITPTGQSSGSFDFLKLKNSIIKRKIIKDPQIPMMILASRNQEISPQLAHEIIKHKKEVLIRSPLSCQAKQAVCQLCYGWSLSQKHLVALGEAVGVIAAQSIGEPGTQLTMRTFHTGGVFSADVLDQIYSPSTGKIRFPSSIEGTLIRTPDGKIAFFTQHQGYLEIVSGIQYENSELLPGTTPLAQNGKVPVDSNRISLNQIKGSLSDYPESTEEFQPNIETKRSFFGSEGSIPSIKKDWKSLKRNNFKNIKIFTINIPPYTALFVRQGEIVYKNQLIGETSFKNENETEADQSIETHRVVSSEIDGEIYFESVPVNKKTITKISLTKPTREFTLQTISGLGSLWILSGKQLFFKKTGIQTKYSEVISGSFSYSGDLVYSKSLIYQSCLFNINSVNGLFLDSNAQISKSSEQEELFQMKHMDYGPRDQRNTLFENKAVFTPKNCDVNLKSFNKHKQIFLSLKISKLQYKKTNYFLSPGFYGSSISLRSSLVWIGTSKTKSMVLYMDPQDPKKGTKNLKFIESKQYFRQDKKFFYKKLKKKLYSQIKYETSNLHDNNIKNDLFAIDSYEGYSDSSILNEEIEDPKNSGPKYRTGHISKNLNVNERVWPLRGQRSLVSSKPIKEYRRSVIKTKILNWFPKIYKTDGGMYFFKKVSYSILRTNTKYTSLLWNFYLFNNQISLNNNESFLALKSCLANRRFETTPGISNQKSNIFDLIWADQSGYRTNQKTYTKKLTIREISFQLKSLLYEQEVRQEAGSTAGSQETKKVVAPNKPHSKRGWRIDNKLIDFIYGSFYQSSTCHDHVVVKAGSSLDSTNTKSHSGPYPPVLQPPILQKDSFKSNLDTKDYTPMDSKNSKSKISASSLVWLVPIPNRTKKPYPDDQHIKSQKSNFILEQKEIAQIFGIKQRFYKISILANRFNPVNKTNQQLTPSKFKIKSCKLPGIRNKSAIHNPQLDLGQTKNIVVGYRSFVSKERYSEYHSGLGPLSKIEDFKVPLKSSILLDRTLISLRRTLLTSKDWRQCFLDRRSITSIFINQLLKKWSLNKNKIFQNNLFMSSRAYPSHRFQLQIISSQQFSKAKTKSDRLYCGSKQKLKNSFLYNRQGSSKPLYSSLEGIIKKISILKTSSLRSSLVWEPGRTKPGVQSKNVLIKKKSGVLKSRDFFVKKSNTNSTATIPRTQFRRRPKVKTNSIQQIITVTPAWVYFSNLTPGQSSVLKIDLVNGSLIISPNKKRDIKNFTKAIDPLTFKEPNYLDQNKVLAKTRVQSFKPAKWATEIGNTEVLNSESTTPSLPNKNIYEKIDQKLQNGLIFSSFFISELGSNTFFGPKGHYVDSLVENNNSLNNAFCSLTDQYKTTFDVLPLFVYSKRHKKFLLNLFTVSIVKNSFKKLCFLNEISLTLFNKNKRPGFHSEFFGPEIQKQEFIATKWPKEWSEEPTKDQQEQEISQEKIINNSFLYTFSKRNKSSQKTLIFDFTEKTTLIDYKQARLFLEPHSDPYQRTLGLLYKRFLKYFVRENNFLLHNTTNLLKTKDCSIGSSIPVKKLFLGRFYDHKVAKDKERINTFDWLGNSCSRTIFTLNSRYRPSLCQTRFMFLSKKLEEQPRWFNKKIKKCLLSSSIISNQLMFGQQNFVQLNNGKNKIHTDFIPKVIKNKFLDYSFLLSQGIPTNDPPMSDTQEKSWESMYREQMIHIHPEQSYGPNKNNQMKNGIYDFNSQRIFIKKATDSFAKQEDSGHNVMARVLTPNVKLLDYEKLNKNKVSQRSKTWFCKEIPCFFFNKQQSLNLPNISQNKNTKLFNSTDIGIMDPKISGHFGPTGLGYGLNNIQVRTKPNIFKNQGDNEDKRKNYTNLLYKQKFKKDQDKSPSLLNKNKRLESPVGVKNINNSFNTNLFSNRSFGFGVGSKDHAISKSGLIYDFFIKPYRLEDKILQKYQSKFFSRSQNLRSYSTSDFIKGQIYSKRGYSKESLITFIDPKGSKPNFRGSYVDSQNPKKQNEIMATRKSQNIVRQPSNKNNKNNFFQSLVVNCNSNIINLIELKGWTGFKEPLFCLKHLIRKKITTYKPWYGYQAERSGGSFIPMNQNRGPRSFGLLYGHEMSGFEGYVRGQDDPLYGPLRSQKKPLKSSLLYWGFKGHGLKIFDPFVLIVPTHNKEDRTLISVKRTLFNNLLLYQTSSLPIISNNSTTKPKNCKRAPKNKIVFHIGKGMVTQNQGRSKAPPIFRSKIPKTSCSKNAKTILTSLPLKARPSSSKKFPNNFMVDSSKNLRVALGNAPEQISYVFKNKKRFFIFYPNNHLVNYTNPRIFSLNLLPEFSFGPIRLFSRPNPFIFTKQTQKTQMGMSNFKTGTSSLEPRPVFYKNHDSSSFKKVDLQIIEKTNKKLSLGFDSTNPYAVGSKYQLTCSIKQYSVIIPNPIHLLPIFVYTLASSNMTALRTHFVEHNSKLLFTPLAGSAECDNVERFEEPLISQNRDGSFRRTLIYGSYGAKNQNQQLMTSSNPFLQSETNKVVYGFVGYPEDHSGLGYGFEVLLGMGTNHTKEDPLDPLTKTQWPKLKYDSGQPIIDKHITDLITFKAQNAALDISNKHKNENGSFGSTTWAKDQIFIKNHKVYKKGDIFNNNINKKGLERARNVFIEDMAPGVQGEILKFYNHPQPKLGSGKLEQFTSISNPTSLLLLTPFDQIIFSTNNTKPIVKIGQFVRYGDHLTHNIGIDKSGQVLNIEKTDVTLRLAKPLLVSSGGTVHRINGDFIAKNIPLLTLSYKSLKTGDIVQGIPKIEELLEARQTKDGKPVSGHMQEQLYSLFVKFSQSANFSPQKAARQSLEQIQQRMVDRIQLVYQSQGISIADKHLEIIVRQMTAKVRILLGGKTKLLTGELVHLYWIESVNKFIKGLSKATYEPVLLPITRAALQSSSFISSASFQETTRVLTRAAIQRKTDFLRGLKESVILGYLIPAGTGYFVHQEAIAKEKGFGPKPDAGQPNEMSKPFKPPSGSSAQSSSKEKQKNHNLVFYKTFSKKPDVFGFVETITNEMSEPFKPPSKSSAQSFLKKQKNFNLLVYKKFSPVEY